MFETFYHFFTICTTDIDMERMVVYNVHMLKTGFIYMNLGWF